MAFVKTGSPEKGVKLPEQEGLGEEGAEEPDEDEKEEDAAGEE